MTFTSYLVSILAIINIEINISFNKSVEKQYFHALKKLKKLNKIVLVGVEGAMLNAVDISQKLVRDNSAIIENVTTSSIPMTSAVTGTDKLRAKIEIIIICNNNDDN